MKGWADDQRKSAHYRCKIWDTKHPWRVMSERLIVRHLFAAVEPPRLQEQDRVAIQARLRRAQPGQAAAVKAREKQLRDIESRRRRIEEGLAGGLIRPERARAMLAELSDREASLPPQPVLAVAAEADLALLESLPAMLARARRAWPDEPEVTRAANAVLREVVARVEWPEPRVKYRPRVYFQPRYAALISVISTVPASRAATASKKRAISSAAGDSAMLA
jgi:hypothetical protein